jgi:hypothetical protein
MTKKQLERDYQKLAVVYREKVSKIKGKKVSQKQALDKVKELKLLE